VDQRRVLDLPTFGGSVMVLVQLAPGVINTTDMRLAKAGSFSINKNSQIATDGAGVYKQRVHTGRSFEHAGRGRVDARGLHSAFRRGGRIQSADGRIRRGRRTQRCSVINVSTKSGTNQLHGQAEWALRNSAFDAPNIFQNRSGQGIPHYTDNRWGLVAGGPVWIPKVYNGKNRTFWFYGYGANHFGVPQSFVSTVPTEAMRRGDLSALLALGSQYQVYDPTTTVAIAGGRFQRQPFAVTLFPATGWTPSRRRS